MKIIQSSIVQKMDQQTVDAYYKELAIEYNKNIDAKRALNPNGFVFFDYPANLLSRQAILEQAIDVAGERLSCFETDEM